MRNVVNHIALPFSGASQSVVWVDGIAAVRQTHYSPEMTSSIAYFHTFIASVIVIFVTYAFRKQFRVRAKWNSSLVLLRSLQQWTEGYCLNPRYERKITPSWS